MNPGDTVAQRFELEREAGRGGMGTVWRARDRVTGVTVALKLMHRDADAARFSREAETLSRLEHLSIVGYLAHGVEAGTPWLATQWLEGCDLARRLEGGALPLGDCLELARRLASGLVFAHEHGVVHRDLKPANIFLPGNAVAAATLLDFGLAQLKSGASLTSSGLMMGTLAYMSPEQASNPKTVDARTDLFALGAVLFECLTGRRAFAAEHAVAVLAKVLTEELPDLREFRPEAPAALAELVAALLRKAPAERPASAAEVLARLGEERVNASAGAPLRAAFGSVEQRPVAVMFVELAAGTSDDASAIAAATEVLRPFTRRVYPLAARTLLGVIDAGAAATDRATWAAAAALALKHAFAKVRIAVSMGETTAQGGRPVGDAVDRCASLLASSAHAEVLLDPLVAGLLNPRFEVVTTESGGRLRGFGRDVSTVRTLMGRPAPCVGRDKELDLLRAALEECATDKVAQAVLLTGEPGCGKTRLAREVSVEVEVGGRFKVLWATADQIIPHVPYALARQLLLATVERSGTWAANLRATEGDPRPDFIAHLAGQVVPDPSPLFRSALTDPHLMADRIESSFVGWLQAECSAAPVLVVLDDVQWGDAPSLALLGAALRSTPSIALTVLATARPEVKETLPEALRLPRLSELALGPLTRRAQAQLVKHALGEEVAAALVDRIIATSDGNAFYLEELIRRGTTQEASGVPDTVLAMAQSRLETVDPVGRQVLRAASIFGEHFEQRGVEQLLPEQTRESITRWLGRLIELELLAPRDGAGHRFRHNLLRLAAYRMSTDTDRAQAHLAAATWLAAGQDPLVVATHLELGGEGARAVPWLLRASMAALDANDAKQALTLARRAVAAGADGVDRGRALSIEGIVVGWSNEMERAGAVQREALSLLPVGSNEWLVSAAGALTSVLHTGDASLFMEVAQHLGELEPQARPEYLRWLVLMSSGLGGAGQVGLLSPVLRQLEREPPTDPLLAAYVDAACVHELMFTGHDLGAMLRLGERALERFERDEDRFGWVQASITHGLTLALAAAWDACAELSEKMLRHDIAVGRELFSEWALWFGMRARFLGRGDPSDEICARLLVSKNFVVRKNAVMHQVDTALASGRLDGLAAEAEAQRSSFFLHERIQGFQIGAELALREEQPARAYELATEGYEFLAVSHPMHLLRGALALNRATALSALSREEEARAVVAEALAVIDKIARSLPASPAAAVPRRPRGSRGAAQLAVINATRGGAATSPAET